MAYIGQARGGVVVLSVGVVALAPGPNLNRAVTQQLSCTSSRRPMHLSSGTTRPRNNSRPPTFGANCNTRSSSCTGPALPVPGRNVNGDKFGRYFRHAATSSPF